MILPRAAMALWVSAATFVIFVSAQTSSAATVSASALATTFPTATILIQGSVTGTWAGSLVQASGCSNTYSLVCLNNAVCGQYTISITQGNSDYVVALKTTSDLSTYYASVGCSLTGFGAAYCTAWASETGPATSSTSVNSYKATGTQLNFAEVPITVGGTNTVDVSTCSASAIAPPGAGSATFRGTSAVAIGVGVGVGVGGALILGVLAVGALFYRRRRKQRMTKSNDAAVEKMESNGNELNGGATPVAEVPGDTCGPAELPMDSARAELPDEEKRAELESKELAKELGPVGPPQELPGDIPQQK